MRAGRSKIRQHLTCVLLFFIIILVSPYGTSGNNQSILPDDSTSDEDTILTLRGFFDGIDDVLLKDDQIWIHHKAYQPPEDFTINGHFWEPYFPNGELEGLSEPLKGYFSLPMEEKNYSIDIIQKPEGGIVRISENPKIDNNFTLVITVDDEELAGAYWYEFEVTTAQYTDHNPIWIDGNSDFISQAGTENWPGNGSALNPFVIEGLNIVGLESETAIEGYGSTVNYPSQRPNYLITIRNVDLHFQIRKNRLMGANQTGIWMRNVENVVINENDISLNSRHGVAISYAKNCLVFNNSLFSNEEAGVGFWESSNCTISYNVVYNNTWSVYAENSSVIINYNTIYDSNGYAIDLYESKDCLISSNVVYDNIWHSVFLWVSQNNKISDNIISDNYYGIELENASNNNIITNNSINGNDEYGVYISSSKNTTVEGNDFTKNNLGGASQAYDDNQSNLFVNNYWSDHTSPDNDGNGIVDEPYSIAGSANNEDIHPMVFAYNPDLIPAVSSTSTSEPYFTETTSRSSQYYSLNSFEGLLNTSFFLIVVFISVGTLIAFIVIVMLFLSRRSRIYDRYPVRAPISIEKPAVQKIETPRKEDILSSDISEEPVEPAQTIPTIKPLPTVEITEITEPVTELEFKRDFSRIVPTVEDVGEDKRSLFSSIQYRVQDLSFEKKGKTLIACLIPYSGSIKEIRVEFDKHRIIMEGWMRGEKIKAPNLEIKVYGEPRRPSWEDPWLDIELNGDFNFIDQIKSRGTMADNFASLGTCTVKIKSDKEGEIHLCIMCAESKETIERAYTLIKELQSFLELSQF